MIKIAQNGKNYSKNEQILKKFQSVRIATR